MVLDSLDMAMSGFSLRRGATVPRVVGEFVAVSGCGRSPRGFSNGFQGVSIASPRVSWVAVIQYIHFFTLFSVSATGN